MTGVQTCALPICRHTHTHTHTHTPHRSLSYPVAGIFAGERLDAARGSRVDGQRRHLVHGMNSVPVRLSRAVVCRCRNDRLKHITLHVHTDEDVSALMASYQNILIFSLSYSRACLCIAYLSVSLCAVSALSPFRKHFMYAPLSTFPFYSVFSHLPSSFLLLSLSLF